MKHPTPFDSLSPEELATAAGGVGFGFGRVVRFFRSWRAQMDANLLEDEFGLGHFAQHRPPPPR